MKTKQHFRLIRGMFVSALVLFTATPLLFFTTVAHCFQFTYNDVQGSLDTTVSYGLAWRVQSRDSDIIGIASGGDAFSVNGDDGNLNYDKGLISNVFKITSELELNYRNLGAFVRGTAFYDIENERSSRERTSLSAKALDLVGSDVDLLDAYVRGKFTLGNSPVQIRIGEQMVSWGESTFIQNSINTINRVNVAAIRLPGSELREALLPEGMVWGSIGTTENTSLEAFYQYDWEEIDIDPVGSYFSSLDIVGDGANKVMLGWGDVPDQGRTPPEDTFMGVPRGATDHADNQGQFGVAFRVFAPALNQTEFGFYFINYNSRLPTIAATTGTLGGALSAARIQIVSPSISRAVDTYLVANPGDIGGAIVVGTAVGVSRGVSPEASQAIAGATATGGNVDRATTVYSTDAYAKTARYRTKYPDGIKLFGVSFNTMLGRTGVALQGEVSHRWDAPLQIDDVELLYATLGGVESDMANFNQIGNYFLQFEQNIDGYIRRDVTQVQATGTKLFGPRFGADQLVVAGEAGVTYVHNMPSKSRLRLEGPATFVSGNPILGPEFHPGKGVEPGDNFADSTSWGYVLVGRLDFNNAIGAINLFPRIAWKHDVKGNSPGPGGNFIEHRKAITFGLNATYLNSWSADISYTNFFGASRRNLINDRDFVACNIKYSF